MYFVLLELKLPPTTLPKRHIFAVATRKTFPSALLNVTSGAGMISILFLKQEEGKWRIINTEKSP